MGVAVGNVGTGEGVKPTEGAPPVQAEVKTVEDKAPQVAVTSPSAPAQVTAVSTPALTTQTITPPTQTAPQPKQVTQLELDTELRNTLTDSAFIARFMQFLKVRQPLGVDYAENPEFSKWLYPELENVEQLKVILSEDDWEKVDRILDKCAQLVGMNDGTKAEVSSDLREKVVPIKIWKFEKEFRFPYRTGEGNKLVYSNEDFSLTVQSGDAGWWQGVNFKLADKKSGAKVSFDSLMQAEPRRAAVINSLVDGIVQLAEDTLATSEDAELKRWAESTLKWEKAGEIGGNSRIDKPFLYDQGAKKAV